MATPRKQLKKLAPFAYVTPITLILLVFVVGSLAISAVLGFTRYNIISPPTFSGLSNYLRLPDDIKFVKTVRNTAVLLLLITPLNTILGLVLSVFLNHNRKRFFGRLANWAVFVPFLCSGAVVGIVWREFLNGNFAPIVKAFGLFGINPAMLLGSGSTALLVTALICVWKDLGYYAVIYSAGLLSIPESYYEAARVDGAGPVSRFLNITLPLMKPSIILVAFLSATTALSVIDMILTMTGGGPNNATATVVVYAYSMCFGSGNAGYAMAIANILLIVVLCIVFLQRRVLSKDVSEV